jgi:hypothetical protein
MRIHYVFAFAAAAAIAPMAASAQTSCERQQANRIAGTVAGAGIGAVVGSNVAGHGAKSEGGVLGAIAGGLIGNQLAKPRTECAHAYGYYDNSGAWHVNNVDRNAANGYYDRDGRWMSGPPRGYYDRDGVWRTGGDGFYTDNGRWVPPNVSGYYDANDRWVAVSTRVGPPPPPGPRFDIRDRIDRSESRGDISHGQARRFRASLDGIVSREASLPHYHGQLEANDAARINSQLDALNADIRNKSRG